MTGLRSSLNKMLGKKLAPVLAVTLAGLLAPHAASAAALCYQTFDRHGRLVHEGRNPPADISNPDSESWAQMRQRGEHVIWQQKQRCGGAEPAIQRSSSRAAAPEGTASLLLDRAPTMAGGPISLTQGGWR